MARIIQSVIFLICAFRIFEADSFSLDMVLPSPHKNSKSPLRTKLNYARSTDASSTTTMYPPKVTTKTNRKIEEQAFEDPIKSIAFLNDPSRRYQKRRRPRALSDFDRERKAMAKAVFKVQAMAKFEEGQRAAERAILSVLKEHNIQDDTILR